MISFRYYIVTIVAIFLALGLGVLAGTTVIDQALVEGLRTQIVDANVRNFELRRQLTELEAQQEFVEEIVPSLLEGRLNGVEAVVVAPDGADDTSVMRARSSLEDAGAEVVAELGISPRMLDPEAARDLGDIIGADDVEAGLPLARQAATAVARRLRAGPPAGEDPLLALLSGGFVVSNSELVKSDLAAVGGADQVIVIVASQAEEPLVRAVMEPMVGALVRDGGVVAVGEGGTTTNPEGGLITLVRSNAELDGHLVTVDGLDGALGGLALVRGLEHLLVTGEGGDYGTGPGARALYPPLEE